MPRIKTQLQFNPDSMTVSDLKKAASVLREIIRAAERCGDDYEEIGIVVSQFADAYEVA